MGEFDTLGLLQQLFLDGFSSRYVEIQHTQVSMVYLVEAEVIYKDQLSVHFNATP